jgi:hypothetical protein
MPEESTQYNFSREQLVKITMFFSRKLTTFGLLEEQVDLQGNCCLPNELSLISDESLLDKCELIISQAQKFLRDLSEYGIDEDSIRSYRYMINDFKILVTNNELLISAKSSSH